jgi:hypothetical protein
MMAAYVTLAASPPELSAAFMRAFLSLLCSQLDHEWELETAEERAVEVLKRSTKSH